MPVYVALGALAVGILVGVVTFLFLPLRPKKKPLSLRSEADSELVVVPAMQVAEAGAFTSGPPVPTTVTPPAGAHAIEAQSNSAPK